MLTDSKFDFKKTEKKWQQRWRKRGVYKAGNLGTRKYYLLVELAYTSGDLHIGHWFAWSAPDAYARFKRMQGYDVLFPVGGFDSFGLPAENAAIKRGIHPKDWTYKNITTMRKQFETMGPSFDWSKEVITSDPDYYKWTQWLFLKLYEKGLAYKAEVISNWCPECKTVLANEHVENGCCWRHTETKVVQKKVPQWLLNITKYADRLIWPKDPKVGWPKDMKEGQNNWIGRKEGINIVYKLADSERTITVFTTTPVNFGATFLVVAPEYAQKNLIDIMPDKNKVEVDKYIKWSLSKSEKERKIDEREKTGVFTGIYAVNHVNNKKIPVWITDFVLGDVGTGAVQGCPGHDKKDFEFAEKYKLPIRRVVVGPDGDDSEIDSIDKVIESGMSGKMINSDFLNDMDFAEAMQATMDYFEKKGWGKRMVTYHLRDWTVSRQRYWGAPIPIIYCDNCGTVPVPEGDLPVVLPEKVDYTPRGVPPLATAESWVKLKCPKCAGWARRDTETMDTYIDSSWYFYRYPDPKYKNGPFNPESIKDWFPIQVYFGGQEHTLGHTLYARFITKFLHDLGYLPFEEFALTRKNHGVILGPDARRMSKSRGNVVNPDEQVQKYGADAVRMYLIFLGPHEEGGAWNLTGIAGMHRFLQRVWRLVKDYKDLILVEEADASEVLIATNKAIQSVTKDIEGFKFNTAIAKIMEFVNFLYEKTSGDVKMATGRIRCAEWDQTLKTLSLLLAPFAPHITEELWVEVLGKKFSIHKSSWPKYDPDLAKETMLDIVVQIDGKLRTILRAKIKDTRIKSNVEKLARKDTKIAQWLEGKKVVKTIFVPGKLINFVTN